jgi:uncharacterized membrane protein YhaH (DUF805 family)
MHLPESLIFPISALTGGALGVCLFRALERVTAEHRTLHLLYALTAGVAVTLWIGFAVVMFVGGGGSRGPLQYAMQDPGALAVFHVRGYLTFVALPAIPASLVPTLALLRRQSADERLIGFVAILALWLWVGTAWETQFYPTV